MNFIEEFKQGQAGANKGIPLLDGLSNLSNAINGIQRGRMFTIASSPKVGKSTLINYAFVFSTYDYCLKHNIPIEWVYFSFEINRIAMEFDFACHYLYYDYGITHISLPSNITVKGESTIPLSSDYLRGRISDDTGNTITLKPSLLDALKETYTRRIVPLFGEYSPEGLLLSKGLITFIEEKATPQSLYHYLLAYAEKEGTFNSIYDTIAKRERKTSFKPNDPNKYTFIIVDHCRLILSEKGATLKQTVDAWSDYATEIRNLTSYTIVNIMHTNREVARTDNLRSAKDLLYPTSEDIKDTGNLSESSDYVLTLFNPNDDRYRLTKHFGLTLKDEAQNLLYPNLRTIHLVESRHTYYPQHFKTNMLGNVKSFVS